MERATELFAVGRQKKKTMKETTLLVSRETPQGGPVGRKRKGNRNHWAERPTSAGIAVMVLISTIVILQKKTKIKELN